MVRIAAALSLALALGAVSVPVAAQLEDALPLARARAAGAGAHVLVDGVVSVPPGLFDGGFAIQDRTGGIWVMPLADPVLLRLGQRVRIRGTLDNPNNQLAIVPSSLQLFEVRGSRGRPVENDAPQPRTMHTGDIDEGREGSLVRVRGRVVTEPENDAPWGWKVMVDDGSGAVMIFIDAETDVDASHFRPGASVEVTGFAGQYGEHYEIVPRTPDDVRITSRN